MSDRRLLVVAAHPDDEVLGCGGTLARLISEGWTAWTVILGEGITSRDPDRDAAGRGADLEALHADMQAANRLLGVSRTVNCGLPDNRFDSLPLLDAIKKIESIKLEWRPSVVFTHFENDLNIDHSVTCRAVLTACRPLQGESVREIYAFEVQSSTEWRYPLSFSPNVFYDIGATLETKLDAMRQYRSEVREYPHPRSIEAMRKSAELWGVRGGLGSAEAFQLLRSMR